MIPIIDMTENLIDISALRSVKNMSSEKIVQSEKIKHNSGFPYLKNTPCATFLNGLSFLRTQESAVS
jgi:hypothetical protein